MSALVPEISAVPPVAATRPRWLPTPWQAGLTGLATAAAAVYLWALSSGSRSEYYAAIALSMSKSWSNFLFGAMDPTGTVSLDKIPGSYWVPALFVRVFGFSTWSVDAPNAIATVGAVVLVAVTAKRIGGPTAGLVAGAITATTPILAAVARTNQPESFFVLALALVAWAGTVAVQRGSLRWLLLTGAFVALAFQMYMMVAWAVWPALAVGYLCTAQPWLRRIWHLAVAGATSLLLSVSWILLVAVTPATARPWVGGTNSNTGWEMVFGYNGLGRFGDTADSADYRSFTPPYSGNPGVLRLFSTAVAGQTAWFLPVALVAVVVLVVLRQSRPVTVMLGGWTLTLVAAFSVVAGMHQFYSAALAVPVGLLIGLAFAAAWRERRRWALIALVVSATATAVAVTRYSPDYLPVVVVVQVALALAAVTIIALAGRRPALGRSPWVAALAAAAMVLTPAAWAVDVINHPNSVNPVAGDGAAASPGSGGAGLFGARRASSGRTGAPGARDGRTGAGGGTPPTGGTGAGGTFPGSVGVDPTVLAHVTADRGGATYLLAAFGAQAASYYITATDGDAVLVIGGFNSADPTPTLDAFTALVSGGQLRFVLVGGGIGGPFTGRGASATSDQIREWVTTNCSPLTGVSGLYDCAATARS